MNRNDINRIFTEKVTELLAQGYQIHTTTMGGSQGEVAHIDLSKGSEILRVLVDRGSQWAEPFGDYLTITVGRNTDRVRGGWSETVWNNHLEIISQIKLIQITNTFFTTPEAAKEMGERRLAHWHNGNSAKREALGDAYKSIGLRWLRRQPRMKTCKLQDIESMERCTDLDGRVSYEIKAKGNRYTMKAARA